VSRFSVASRPEAVPVSIKFGSDATARDRAVAQTAADAAIEYVRGLPAEARFEGEDVVLEVPGFHTYRLVGFGTRQRTGARQRPGFHTEATR